MPRLGSGSAGVAGYQRNRPKTWRQLSGCGWVTIMVLPDIARTRCCEAPLIVSPRPWSQLSGSPPPSSRAGHPSRAQSPKSQVCRWSMGPTQPTTVQRSGTCASLHVHQLRMGCLQQSYCGGAETATLQPKTLSWTAMHPNSMRWSPAAWCWPSLWTTAATAGRRGSLRWQPSALMPTPVSACCRASWLRMASPGRRRVPSSWRAIRSARTVPCTLLRCTPRRWAPWSCTRRSLATGRWSTCPACRGTSCASGCLPSAPLAGA
mmetsp:Transcript_46061/g.147113  ORF Transcript_46061/g.147113 Transcript_46061/m.147113 type:complete len:263 (+) Transcript_46061:990-1778(+)